MNTEHETVKPHSGVVSRRAGTEKNGKSIAITTKVDAELRRKLTGARTRAHMSESGYIRMALESHLDNIELRSIAAEISHAAGMVAAAAESVSQPAVITRMDALEVRVQDQLNELVKVMKGLLGEPMDPSELAALTKGEPS